MARNNESSISKPMVAAVTAAALTLGALTGKAVYSLWGAQDAAHSRSQEAGLAAAVMEQTILQDHAMHPAAWITNTSAGVMERDIRTNSGAVGRVVLQFTRGGQAANPADISLVQMTEGNPNEQTGFSNIFEVSHDSQGFHGYAEYSGDELAMYYFGADPVTVTAKQFGELARTGEQELRQVLQGRVDAPQKPAGLPY